MTRARLLACRLAAALAATTAAGAQDPTRVVITRPQIEASGWVTIGELLGGATGWQRSTLDGVWVFASADGVPPGAAASTEPEWLLLVDGQRVTATALGATLLELIPLSPAQVESVTVTRAPRLVAGTIVGRGVVELHTRRPPRRASVDGAWHSGNVIGDPGPYGFTPLGGTNVDRLGPYNHAYASFGGAGWDVGVGARQGSSHITHRGIRERFDPATFDALGEHKWAPYDAVNARVGGAIFGGRHDLVAGRGWVNGPLFLPLVGHEQWLVGALDHLGGSGSIGAGATTIGYQLTHSALEFAEQPSPFQFVAGHSRRRTSGVIELGVRGDRDRRVRFGAGATRWSLERGGSADRTDATVFADLAAVVGRFTHELSAALARSSGSPLVPKGAFATRVVTDSLTALSLTLSYVEHSSDEDGMWIDRALLGLDTLSRGRGARAWADVGAMRRIRAGWTADLGARIGAVSGVRLLAVPGVQLGEAVNGGLAEARAGLSRRLTPRLPVARAAYRYATGLSGGAQLRDVLRATPAHALEANLVAAVARDLRLGAFVYVASSTHWVPVLFESAPAVTLPAIARVDVSVEKWFWRHRVRTQLLVRNLLNRSERYHPLGADFPLRAHLTFALALPPM